MTTYEDLMAVAKADALRDGGVDNWDGYDDSLEDFGYEPTGNEFNDAKSFLNALANGGVDNWEWHDESISGLDDYEDYLNSLTDLNKAMPFFSFVEFIEAEAKKRAEESAVVSDEDSKVDNTPALDTQSEKLLYDFIVLRFDVSVADEIFAGAKDKGIWKSNTFPAEFKRSLKVFENGVNNPLEKARIVYLELLSKKGKLDGFLDEVNADLEKTVDKM